MIKEWIQDYLGISTIQETQTRTHELMKGMDWNFSSRLTQIDKQLGVVLPGLGRVIAKLDPMFGTSELEPARKAESDRLGQQAIDRLTADMMARKHTLGEL